MGFTIFRAVMTVLFCLLLLALFWFPSQYLVRICTQALERIEEAKAALLYNDPAAARPPCDALCALYAENELALERFLNHESIDAFGSALSLAQAALTVGDTAAAYESLTEAESLLVRLRGIELFSANSLL